MENEKIAVVIPCYKVERQIEKVIKGLPELISSIILVNDCSPDNTKQIIDNLALNNNKITTIHHSKNQGVGGAMISGFKEALKQKCTLVIKIDGDNQMNPKYIPQMIKQTKLGYDYVKGNRFFDRKAILKMPKIRKLGNLILSFLTKISSGYWNIADPTNGYFCIKSEILKRINFDKISHDFFFESSLIIEIFYTGAKIKDLSIPAIYNDEKSNLSELKAIFTFPPRLFYAFMRRLWLRYFVCDFNICSIYLMIGLPLFLFGIIFGIIKWYYYVNINSLAPTGTIMIPVLAIVLGFQMILASIQYDMTAKNPFEIDVFLEE